MSNILWKEKLVGDETGYLAKEIAKQSIDGVAGYLLLRVKCKKREMN